MSNTVKCFNDFALKDNMNASDYFSSGMWHYTSVDSANKILDTKSFRLSSFANMNDLNEKALYGAESENIFSFCFVNSDTEKIPMWYLYSGISGKGVALGLTASKIISFIKSVDKVYDFNTKEEYSVGKDFDFHYGWVYYRDESRYFYRNKWFDKNETDKEKLDYFVKDYPWNYEKEFRFVFVNKTGKKSSI